MYICIYSFIVCMFVEAYKSVYKCTYVCMFVSVLTTVNTDIPTRLQYIIFAVGLTDFCEKKIDWKPNIWKLLKAEFKDQICR